MPEFIISRDAALLIRASLTFILLHLLICLRYELKFMITILSFHFKAIFNLKLIFKKIRQ